MFKFKKKHFVTLVSVCLALTLLTALIPAFRITLLNNTVRAPLYLFTLLRQEVGALIFYHRNFVQNTQLKKEIDLLRHKIVSQNEADLENERLKKLLSLKQASPYKVIAARVIARAADSFSSVVIVDKGSFQGLRRGMVVISYLGLAGRVIEAAKSTSKVLLLSDPNLSVSAIVQRSRQEGLVAGTLGSNLVMKYLTEGSDIKVGDAVVTSGLNAAYPKGLIIGRVIDINKDFSGLSRYAIIKPAVNFSNIEEVLIIVQ